MTVTFHFYFTNTFNSDWKICSSINSTAFIHIGSQTVANCMQFQGFINSSSPCLSHRHHHAKNNLKKKTKQKKNGRRTISFVFMQGKQLRTARVHPNLISSPNIFPYFLHEVQTGSSIIFALHCFCHILLLFAMQTKSQSKTFLPMTAQT